MKRFARNTLTCIPAAAFAFVIAPIVTIDNAKAACTPAAPVNDTTVTCTGTTTDQNPPNGYGTGSETSLTINVVTGASVTGTNGNGLRVLSATINNNGTIGGAAFGIRADNPGNATINNLGMILGSLGGISSTGINATINNSGTIIGSGADSFGILALPDNSLRLTNTGSISGVVGIFADRASTIISSGDITGTGGTAIQLGDQNDSVTIQKRPFTFVTGTVDLGGGNDVLRNDGAILGAFQDNGIPRNVDGVRSTGTLTVINSNEIEGGHNQSAIAGNIVTVTNLKGGLIFGAAGGNELASKGITANIARVENAGFILGFAFGIQTNELTLTNFESGQVSAGAGSPGIGISAGTSNINNFGTINGAAGAITGGVVNLANGTSGRIEGFFQGFGGGVAIDAASVNVHSNAGTITGTIGIRAVNASTVTNSGTIEGTGGTAIKFGPQADTLTLLPGSKIIGVVDMGGGEDTVNVGANAVTLTSRVSSFFKAAPVEIPVLVNFTGTLNTNGTVSNPSANPFVQAGGAVASLDPTAFGQADRGLMNFTGGVSSLVQGRLGGRAANGSAVQVVSFAPTGASGRTEEAFAAISAMGYAKEPSRPRAHPFTYADAPYNVWTSGFGGTSTQKGDDTMLRSTASAGAAVIGVDRQVRPDLLIGAFAGSGAGRLSVELNSQSVDTEYATGGVYGRFDWVSHFLDFTLQGGATINKSKRLVLTDAGSESATASYDSWYISPEVAYGRRYHFANGYTLTPVGRIRYLAGTFDGYNEAGSAQNLAVNRRTLHDLEERAEVELSKITGVGAGSFRTNVHGGLIALQRLGNPTINTVLIGQDLSFTTPGKASSAGVVAGAGFDFRATERMSLFGAVEATVLSGGSRTAAGKAGLIFAF